MIRLQDIERKRIRGQEWVVDNFQQTPPWSNENASIIDVGEGQLIKALLIEASETCWLALEKASLRPKGKN